MRGTVPRPEQPVICLHVNRFEIDKSLNFFKEETAVVASTEGREMCHPALLSWGLMHRGGPRKGLELGHAYPHAFASALSSLSLPSPTSKPRLRMSRVITPPLKREGTAWQEYLTAAAVKRERRGRAGGARAFR